MATAALAAVWYTWYSAAEMSREGRADDWIGVFADAVSTSARSATALGSAIDRLLGELIE
jgi:hypothetical protein